MKNAADRDGDLDLLLGRSRYSLVLNETIASKPVFSDAVALECDGKPIPYGLVPPCIADWDSDGADDLLTGRENDIVWYRNIGMKGKPQQPKGNALAFVAPALSG